jgi:hypothetical protein
MFRLPVHVANAIFLSALVLGGCGAAATETEADSPSATEDAVTTTERAPILESVRAQVKKDFAGAAWIRSHKPVFVVRALHDDGRRAFVRARILKRDASGKDRELQDSDFAGSVYEDDIREGLFDGPELIAALEKKESGWAIMQKMDGTDVLTAYMVGPTDVGWAGWDEEFGLPRAWLGF